MKKLFYFFFTLELVGLGGFFGKIAYQIVQSLQSNITGDMSKDTMVLLAILFFAGFIGFLASNKYMDQLNRAQ